MYLEKNRFLFLPFLFSLKPFDNGTPCSENVYIRKDFKNKSGNKNVRKSFRKTLRKNQTNF